MKSWIAERLGWMDANMIGNCDEDITTTKAVLSENDFSFAPNPAVDYILLSNLKGDRIVIHDATGKKQISTSIRESEKRLNVSSLSSGMYFITKESEENRITKKLVIL